MSLTAFSSDRTPGLDSIVGVLRSHLERRSRPELAALAHLRVVAKARMLVAACQVPLATGGLQPFYAPDDDLIVMPSPAFYTLARLIKRPKRYAIDVLHELIHASGHKSRLGRPRHTFPGDLIYQREELTAELGAVLLMHDLGISGRPILPHATYLKHWLQGLENPRLELDLGMARANQAAGFVIAVAKRNLAKGVVTNL
jgi:antirestriction protein ArdC